MNNRYKVRLSKESIFWTTNSQNHPSKSLWEKTYLPTFEDIEGSPINWIDIFTISTIVDDSSYTMLELTDTVTNEVIYFLSKSISKKLQNGFEMIFTIDIYLTFGIPFIDWLIENKLLINVKRFLNNTLLKEWFKQFKFIQKDELLNFNGGSVKLDNNIEPQIIGIYRESYNDMLNGTIYTYQNTSTNIDTFKLSYEGQGVVNFDSPLFWVFETTDGRYMCLFTYGINVSNGNTSINNVILTQTEQSTGKVSTYVINVYSDFVKNNVATADYWVDKLVGVFSIPFWKYIQQWILFDMSLTKPTDNPAANPTCLLGFIIDRSQFIKLSTNQDCDIQINYNYKSVATQNTFVSEVPNINDNKNYGGLLAYQTFFYNLFEFDGEFMVDYTTKMGQEIEAIPINSYFVSQISNDKTNLQFAPVNGFWNPYAGGIFEFDGIAFNCVNKQPNTTALIQNGYGTINVAIDSFKEFVASTKPQFNTNLEVMNANNTLQKQKNSADLIASSAGSLLSGIFSIFTGGSGGVGGVGSIAKNIVDTSFNNAQLDLNYQNLQKQQDAQIASSRISSTAQNISASNTTDDAIQKFLINQDSWFDLPQAGYVINTMYYSWDTFMLGNFFSTKNDLAYYHNLIVKNGIVGNMTITADLVFNDTFIQTDYKDNPNHFLYVDFTCDVDYIRLFKPNMPSDYVKALGIICDNAMRIWSDKMSLDTNESFYFYCAFYEQAKQAQQEMTQNNAN